MDYLNNGDGKSDNYYTTDEQILYFADETNAVPRKQLGYKTPEEFFEEFLDKVYSLNSAQVA